MKAERESESACSLARPRLKRLLRPNGSLCSHRQEMKAAAAVLGGGLAGSSGSPCSWIAFNFLPKMVVIRTGALGGLTQGSSVAQLPETQIKLAAALSAVQKLRYGENRWAAGTYGRARRARRHMLGCVIGRTCHDWALVSLACI